MDLSITYIIEQLVSGLVAGCCYALMGVGLSLVWGILKMISINHGELYMTGAYMMWLALSLGMPLFAAVVAGVVSTMALSLLIEVSMIGPLTKKPGWNTSPFILTMAISVFLQNAALRIFGEKYHNVPYFSDNIYKIFSLNISGQRVWIVVVTIITILALMLFIRYTRMGRAIRATSQEREAATLMGVNTKTVFVVTYVISGALAAIAGIMLSPIYSVNPWMGSAIQTKGLVVCVLAGLGSIEGAIGAGLILGLSESIAVTFVGSQWKDIVSYLILLVILWVKPNGLFLKSKEA